MRKLCRSLRTRRHHRRGDLNRYGFQSPGPFGAGGDSSNLFSPKAQAPVVFRAFDAFGPESEVVKTQPPGFSGTSKTAGRVFIFETLFGPSALLYRESPFAVFRTFLPCKTRSDLLADIAAEGRFPEGAHPLARKVARSMIDYFKGRPLEIEWPPWPWLDLGELTPLQRAVLEETARIPYGKTRAYGDIAAAVGRPKACRFVGSTMAKNPFPLLIPCHRVVRSDGSPGEFGGGTPLKQALIDLERRTFDKLGKSRNWDGKVKSSRCKARKF